MALSCPECGSERVAPLTRREWFRQVVVLDLDVAAPAGDWQAFWACVDCGAGGAVFGDAGFSRDVADLAKRWEREVADCSHDALAEPSVGRAGRRLRERRARQAQRHGRR